MPVITGPVSVFRSVKNFCSSFVGDVDDVFVLDGEALSEEIGVRVAHIEAVDDWRTAIGPCAQLGSIERCHDGRGLEAEEKHPVGSERRSCNPPALAIASARVIRSALKVICAFCPVAPSTE